MTISSWRERATGGRTHVVRPPRSGAFWMAAAMAAWPLATHASSPLAGPRCTAPTGATVSNTSNAAVPDNGVLVRTFTVAGAGPVLWDLDVVLNVTHPNSGDLDVTLTSPAGTVVTLTTDNGGTNDNVFAGTRFDDQADTPVTDAATTNLVALATVAPEQPLDRFYGQNPNGVWTLSISDDAATNVGAFVSASLVLATVPEPPNDVGRLVTLSPGTAIADNSTITSTQTVRGGGAFVTRVRLRTFVTHTFPNDLDITLTSPGGTGVTVTTDNGGGNDNVFNGTTWDDRTGSPASDFTYVNATVATSLSPEEGLSSFVGEAANGVWTLSVTDDAGGDVGSLVRWDLEVFTGSCAKTPGAPPGFAAPITTTVSDATTRLVPPTGTSGTTTTTLAVSGAGPYLWDLNVVTQLLHTFSGDLAMRLTSPQGTTVTLTSRNGGSTDNVFGATRWDDQADEPVTDAQLTNLEPKRALVPEGAFGALIGENPNGTWTLTIADEAAGDNGSLTGWSLEVTTLATPPQRTPVTITDTTAVAIPDGTQSGTVRSRTVAGLGAFLTRARLVTTLAHPAPSQIEMFLTSPAGTTVTITTGNGANNANVFNGTSWEDLAGKPPVTDATYVAGVAQSSLVPEEAMSAFIGENPNGTWTLTVLDTATGQTGTLSNWSLVLETGAAFNLRQTLTAAPAGVAAGTALVLTAQVESTGPGDAPGPLTLTVPLPTTIRFTSISAPAGWTCITPAVGTTGTVSCTRAVALPASTTSAVVVNTAVAPGVPVLTQISTTATVQTTTAEANTADNVATVIALVVLPTTGDTDGDSLPNSWETQFGLDPAAVNGSDGPFADPDGDGRTNAQELAEGTHPRGFHTRYFAEGATSTFFDTRFALLNTSGVPALTLMRFLPASGPAIGQPLSVAANARATVLPKSIAGLQTAEFATVIEADQPVVIDRTMTWDGSGYGSHAEASVAAPDTQWYLAEGATHSGFELFYLLQNANASQATATIEYLLPSGAPVVRTYVVPPNSRQTIWINTDAALASTDVSASITSDLPIIVERAMYLNRPGQTFAAGHESAAVTAPNTDWFLAEGATGPYFDLFVLIANPSNTPAAITARFLKPDGTTVNRAYAVPPKSRFNIWVDQEGPELADTAVSTTITSDIPVLVERAMWWPGDGNTWHEAHNTFGATSTGVRWVLAEGEQGGASSAETYVLVANTSAFTGSVRVTLHKEDGATLVKTFPINPNSRLNVPIGAAEVDGGFGPANVNGRRFGVVVESLVPGGSTVPAQIVVERAMYSNANGVIWAAGTNALATKIY